MSLFKAPFPYFGGKSKIAPLIWERLGQPRNYVEPFAGSLAVLLKRPGWSPAVNWIETVNDKDGFIANFWRALAASPREVARHADWPVNENDLHARHIWLVNHRDDLTAKLEGDPEYFDAKIAGWWVWGISCWIGSGWCSGDGPWQSVDGQRVHLGDAGQGVQRQRVHLGDAGQGVQRQRVHLGDAGQGVQRKLVHLGDAGRGVQRQLVHLGDAGRGENGLLEWFTSLAARLRRVRVCSGDWSRVMGESVTFKHGLTAVFLDPPYSAEAGRDNTLYAQEDLSVAHDAREWAIANGDNPLLRIVLCGYDTEHSLPDGWERVAWTQRAGYSNSNQDKGGGRGEANRKRETLWFSQHCLKPARTQQLSMFDHEV